MSYQKLIFPIDDVQIDIKINEEEMTVWLSKEDLATLFHRNRSVISKHIKNIYEEGHLQPESTCAKNAQVQLEGDRKVARLIEIFNIDIAIEIGHRVNSQNGLLLKQFVEEYFQEKTRNIQPNIIVYNNGDIKLDVNVSPEEETVWLSQQQIAKLFETTISNISMHIRNVLNDGEIGNSVIKDFLTTQPNITQFSKEILTVAQDGKQYLTIFYNLDMILAVGYRVKSQRAIDFRRWATSVLKRYLLKGYVIHEERALVTKENFDHLSERVTRLEIDMRETKSRESYHVLNEKLILDGRVFDAIKLIDQILSNAKEKIVLIDPYIDTTTLSFFTKLPSHIKIILISSSRAKLTHHDLKSFKDEYHRDVFYFQNDLYHDRYLCLDDEIIYHLGCSLNYAGYRLSEISLIKDKDNQEYLIKRMKNLILN